MIKGIINGNGIVVHNGNPVTPYISPGAQSAGMLRYNSNSNNMEVYDGVTWLTMSTSYASIELSPDVQNVIQWAREKMEQERKIKALAEKHSAVADALAAVEHAQQQLDIVTTLVQK
jgi:UDP-3-O-acyl-N-acetylglucosamine deacetylase